MDSFRNAKYVWFGALIAAFLGCSRSSEKQSEPVGAQQSAIIPLNAQTTVNDCRPNAREPKCPGGKLPDQCGTWAGIELKVSRAAKGKTEVADEHCTCEPIAFQIPAELSITQGGPGGVDWDKPDLSFRTTTTVVECRYRVGGAGKYVFEKCSDGSLPGQTKQSDWFKLALDGSSSATALELRLRLGEADVVGGVVQEQVFYSDDPKLPAAALHVPRGSAPSFETFSLDALNVVTLGTTIPNAGDPATTVSLPVDVHADSTDQFVFTKVPGASCPRIELPYDQATLERLGGPAGEHSLKAHQITTLTGITSGAQVLAPAGAVTVDLARRTFSFCVEHLSVYVGSIGDPAADLTFASIRSTGSGPALLLKDLLTTRPLPLLSPGQTYELTLGFTNTAGPTWVDQGTTHLVAVGKPEYPPAPAEPVVTPVGNNDWNIQVETSPGVFVTTTEINKFSPASVGYNQEATFTLYITAPSTPKHLNFCMRAGASNYFGDCFTWDVEGTGSTEVAMPETCNNVDDDLNGVKDDGLTQPCYPPDPSNPTGAGLKGRCHAGLSTCASGSWGPCIGAVGPATSEACNNVDDDCDGAVDEMPAQACYGGPSGTSGKGQCHDGSQVCAGGTLVCLGEVRPSTLPDTCDGKDNDCDGATDEDGAQTYYLDRDRDGFVDYAAPLSVCGTPPGDYISVPPPGDPQEKRDCCDLDPDARPGQTSFFARATGCGGFDFDCDTVETPSIETYNACGRPAGGGCNMITVTGPACGKTTKVLGHLGMMGETQLDAECHDECTFNPMFWSGCECLTMSTLEHQQTCR